MYEKASRWVKTRTVSGFGEYSAVLDDDGLLAQNPDSVSGRTGQNDEQSKQKNEVLVKKVVPAEKNASLEKLQDGFNKLIDQLQGINLSS